jgi:hypothetical protein
MLYFLSIWTLLLVGCAICGCGLLKLFAVSWQQDCPDGDSCYQRIIIATWLGMLAIANTLLATALFVPLSPQIGGAIGTIGMLLSLRSPATRGELVMWWQSFSRLHLFIYFGSVVAIAILYSQPVRWYDSGLYHFSLIRWLANFGTVPGIALLVPNFGFTSAWFAFSAPLNADWSIDRTGATANGLVFLLLILQLLITLGRLIRQQGQLSDWFVAIYDSFLLLFLTIRISVIPDILISPSPDIPALLLVAIVAGAILTIETDSHPDRFALNRQILPLLLAIGAVSIKLTALPLLFVTGIWFVLPTGDNRQRIQRAGIVVVLTGLSLLPFLLSNLVASGCPLYPSSAFCLDLPWTVGTDRSIANETHQWVRWYGKPPAGTPAWLAAIVLSVSCGLYLLKTPTLAAIDRISSMWLMALATVGIGFFLLTSPLNRFMLPYLFLLPAFTLAIYARDRFAISSSQPLRWQTGTVAKLPIHSAKTVAIGVLSIATIVQVRGNYDILLLPPSVKQVATIERQVNDFTYFSPIGSKDKGCWTIDLPCAYPPVRARLSDPRQGLKAGFIRN